MTLLEDDVFAWLRRISEAEHPAASVVAYNIGLFETADGYTAYLIGAERYDPSDSSWACDETFTPKERYLVLPLERDGERWQRVLELLVEAVRQFLLSSSGAASFLAGARAVTVGFDDGDLVPIGAGHALG